MNSDNAAGSGACDTSSTGREPGQDPRSSQSAVGGNGNEMSPPTPGGNGNEANDAAGATSSAGTTPVDPERLKQDVVDVLRTIYDPEIPVNIYEIGLIYDLGVDPSGRVDIRMTLTSPLCPVAESLPPEVEAKINAVPGVNGVTLDLVWDPPWNPDMMSEEAKLDLGFF